MRSSRRAFHFRAGAPWFFPFLCSSPRSSAAARAPKTDSRRYRLSVAGTTVQGAQGVLVRSSISSAASRYSSYRSCALQSCRVTRQDSYLLFSIFSNLRRCSCRERCRKNLTMSAPSSVSIRSNWLISWKALSQASLGTAFSTRSASTRRYQERSKMAMPPRSGSRVQNLHRNGRSFSSSVGARVTWTW